MSEAKHTARALPKGRDRWGLRPVRRGRVRGQIVNLRRSFEVGEFGNLLVVDFELAIDKDLPTVPVRMSGTIFNHEPREGMVVEMPDPDPLVRPIVTHRLSLPWDRHHQIVAFYPGRGDPSRARQRLVGVLVVLLPMAVAAVLLGLYFALGW